MMPQKKKEPSAEALALLAEFDSLLAKDKTPQAKKGTKTPSVSLPTPHRFSLIAESKSWKPQYREIVVMRQYCKECGDSTDYVAGELAHFVSKKLRAKNAIPLHSPDLPLRLRLQHESVEQCPRCLQFEALTEMSFCDSKPKQLDLWEHREAEIQL